MSEDLKIQLAQAENLVFQLQQQILHGLCKDIGHSWKFIGGRNAGCSDICDCSIPVYTCSKCGDCDYGDNDEAEETKTKCELEKGI